MDKLALELDRLATSIDKLRLGIERLVTSMGKLAVPARSVPRT